jgi:NADP-dependent 3-hydroxy acid dehydrogenase YdfG
MPDLIDLAGRVVIVTGASSGIGESTARLLQPPARVRCWPRAAPTGWPR